MRYILIAMMLLFSGCVKDAPLAPVVGSVSEYDTTAEMYEDSPTEDIDLNCFDKDGNELNNN